MALVPNRLTYYSIIGSDETSECSDSSVLFARSSPRAQSHVLASLKPRQSHQVPRRCYSTNHASDECSADLALLTVRSITSHTKCALLPSDSFHRITDLWWDRKDIFPFESVSKIYWWRSWKQSIGSERTDLGASCCFSHNPARKKIQKQVSC